MIDKNTLTSYEIISALPYGPPFLFVDDIEYVDPKKIKGKYTFKTDELFYKGHFINNNSITPGVILIETLGQIGFVSFGVYLLNLKDREFHPFFSDVRADFCEKVLPGETVWVESELVFLRAGYLRCNAVMRNKKEQIVIKGTGTCKFVIYE